MDDEPVITARGSNTTRGRLDKGGPGGLLARSVGHGVCALALGNGSCMWVVQEDILGDSRHLGCFYSRHARHVQPLMLLMRPTLNAFAWNHEPQTHPVSMHCTLRTMHVCAQRCLAVCACMPSANRQTPAPRACRVMPRTEHRARPPGRRTAGRSGSRA